METPNPGPFNLGDKVKILHTNLVGRLVAFLGPFGPKGAQVYRIRLWKKPKPSYTEVLGEQLEVISPKAAEKTAPALPAVCPCDSGTSAPPQ